jgi:hypothetical protein
MGELDPIVTPLGFSQLLLNGPTPLVQFEGLRLKKGERAKATVRSLKD